MDKTQALFLSHGGGPLPLLGDPGHTAMVTNLESLAGRVRVPDALVVVSAHWEASVPTITSGANPGLIYDYHGFPPESYTIEYPCPGEPALAAEVHRRLQVAGIDAHLDPARGFDHGLFVPLKIMYPEAQVPCVQLSLVETLDPAQHFEIGRALAGLHESGVWVVGSGFSFHNLRAFFTPDTQESRQLNQSFEAWLEAVCCGRADAEDARAAKLVHWDAAPGARFCHPRAEHLLPLHVCYGVAGGPAAERIGMQIMGKEASCYRW